MSQPSEPSDELKRIVERQYGSESDRPILNGGPYPCCPSRARLDVVTKERDEALLVLHRARAYVPDHSPIADYIDAHKHPAACEHGNPPADCYRCYQLDVIAESRR